MRYLTAIITASCCAVLTAGQNPPGAAFDVVSIKRNTTNTFASGPPPNPLSGEFALTNAPVQAMILRAFPSESLPLQVTGLPAWAESERYDVLAKAKRGATQGEQRQMWKAMLIDRMKLQTHYETRSRSVYRLVLSRDDHRLGPRLKPSTLGCTPPAPDTRREPSAAAQSAMMATIRERRSATPQEEAAMMSQCGGVMNAWNTMYAGGLEMRGLIGAVTLFFRPDRPVIDATGLEGYYSVALTAGRPSTGPPQPDDPPSIFSALPDQLGLKLEPGTTDAPVLVIDHMDRPTEN